MVERNDPHLTEILKAASDPTRVDLSHVRFLSGESRDNHAMGWAGMLVNLETFLA